MSEEARSEQACTVCGKNTLALDRPPEIDVMGVQAYSDMVGMGDLHSEGEVGIVCLTCNTLWRDKAAFDRGEAEPDEDPDAEVGVEVDFSDEDGDRGGAE